MLQYFTSDILLFFAGQRDGCIIGKDPIVSRFSLMDLGMMAQIFIEFSSTMHGIRSKVQYISAQI